MESILFCIVNGKYSVLYTNSIVSLVQTFQLSEHPLVPACADKWLCTVHVNQALPLFVQPCQGTRLNKFDPALPNICTLWSRSLTPTWFCDREMIYYVLCWHMHIWCVYKVYVSPPLVEVYVSPPLVEVYVSPPLVEVYVSPPLVKSSNTALWTWQHTWNTPKIFLYFYTVLSHGTTINAWTVKLWFGGSYLLQVSVNLLHQSV